jgi:hypothetical protein
MPASSVQQWEFMRSVCDGKIPPPEGMTQQQACEYVASQPNPGGLPQTAAQPTPLVAGKGLVVGERAADWLTGAYSGEV